MGYLATLNPLGYNPNQLDLFYLILGTMVARLKTTPGEKELGLIFAMQRTCIALTQDFPGAAKKLRKMLQAFVAKPAHRLKDKTKNLLVLLGYVLSLPLDVVQSVIGSGADWHTFWLHILNESLRRAMEAVHGRTAKEDINALLDSIAHPTSSPLSLEEVASHPFTSLTCPYNAGGGAATFRGGKQECKKYAMEVSSSDDESECSENAIYHDGGGATFGFSRGRGGGTRGGRGGFGSLVLPLRGRGGSVVVRGGRGAAMRGGATVGPSGRQSRTAPASATATTTITTTSTPQPFVAKPEQDGRVKRWVEQLIAHGDEESTLPDLVDDDEVAALDVKSVTREMLDVLLQLGQSFNQHGHPSLSALISLATFTHSWLDLQRHAGGTQVMLHDIDSNGGVAPNSWIVATKQAFKHRSAQPATFASCLEVFALATSQAAASPQHGRDWLVTMRAMAVQALRLKVNKDCREAIQKGDYLDPVTQAPQVLAKSSAELLASKEKDTKKKQRNDQLRYAIHRCLTTDDMTTFAGYLMSKQGFGGKRNSQAFKELYMKFQHVDMAKTIPLGVEKLQVLITGQWCGDERGTTINVLDGGQAWQPGIRRSKKKYRNNARRFERVWGPAALQ